jgi:hypothetical protein
VRKMKTLLCLRWKQRPYNEEDIDMMDTDIIKRNTKWIEPHPVSEPGFGLASLKQEGTTVFYDFNGFDRQPEVDAYKKLCKRFWQTKKVRKEADDIMGNIIAYDLEELRRVE